MKNFTYEVTLERTVTESATFKIQSDSQTAAEQLAQKVSDCINSGLIVHSTDSEVQFVKESRTPAQVKQVKRGYP